MNQDTFPTSRYLLLIASFYNRKFYPATHRLDICESQKKVFMDIQSISIDTLQSPDHLHFVMQV